MPKEKNLEKTLQILHALPLRDVVIFPQMTATILVGREKSVNSVEEAKNLVVDSVAPLVKITCSVWQPMN